MSSGFAIRGRPRFVLNERGGLRECFFLFRQGEEEGPYSFEELEELRDSGKIPPATPCRARAAKEWHDLAFILKEAADDGSSEPGESTPSRPSLSAAVKVEPMNKLVMDLVELSRRQNRLLASIKWSLFGLALVLLGGFAAMAVNAL